jgi:hypothetical protein
LAAFFFQQQKGTRGMCAYQVCVGLARGAGADFGSMVVHVIAGTPMNAAMIAEWLASRRLKANEYAHAKSVDQVWPPSPGPTALAVAI